MNALDDLASDNDRLRLLRIETISVEVVRRRYKAAFDISSGSTPDLISLLVKIRAGGETGVGETTPMTAYSGETLGGLAEVINDHLARIVIGHSVFDLAGLHAAMDRAIRGRRLAKAAIDMGLFDLQGKLLDVPVTTLLGGRVREQVDMAWVIGMGTIAGVGTEAVDPASTGF